LENSKRIKKYILSNKQKFLNLGLDYNVVGEIVEKKKRKKNGQKERKDKNGCARKKKIGWV
jgi:hypothetical protein